MGEGGYGISFIVDKTTANNLFWFRAGLTIEQQLITNYCQGFLVIVTNKITLYYFFSGRKILELFTQR